MFGFLNKAKINVILSKKNYFYGDTISGEIQLTSNKEYESKELVCLLEGSIVQSSGKSTHYYKIYNDKLTLENENKHFPGEYKQYKIKFDIPLFEDMNFPRYYTQYKEIPNKIKLLEQQPKLGFFKKLHLMALKSQVKSLYWTLKIKLKTGIFGINKNIVLKLNIKPKL